MTEAADASPRNDRARPHALLNALDELEARRALTRCCGAARWVEGMLAGRPFPSEAALYALATESWSHLEREDFLEAFSHHPRIGGGSSATANAPVDTAAWSRAEQARVAEANDETLQTLRAANEQYLRRFGYIFIVCATGKSAPEMLALLEARLGNPPERELAIAAAEQAKITRLRLEKLGT